MPTDSGSHDFASNAQNVFVRARRLQGALAQYTEWTVALEGAEAAEPTLVVRLDHPDDYYYIVDFMKGSRIAARMGVGGHPVGDDPYPLLRVSGVGSVDSEVPPFVAVSTFLGARIGEPWGLGAARDRIVRAEAVSVHPLLGWKPCAQSRSPLLPFYLLTVGDVVYYLRVDGELFHQLTQSQPGR